MDLYNSPILGDDYSRSELYKKRCRMSRRRDAMRVSTHEQLLGIPYGNHLAGYAQMEHLEAVK